MTKTTESTDTSARGFRVGDTVEDRTGNRITVDTIEHDESFWQLDRLSGLTEAGIRGWVLDVNVRRV